jgi:hypothetical protein
VGDLLQTLLNANTCDSPDDQPNSQPTDISILPSRPSPTCAAVECGCGTDLKSICMALSPRLPHKVYSTADQRSLGAYFMSYTQGLESVRAVMLSHGWAPQSISTFIDNCLNVHTLSESLIVFKHCNIPVTVAKAHKLVSFYVACVGIMELFKTITQPVRLPFDMELALTPTTRARILDLIERGSRSGNVLVRRLMQLYSSDMFFNLNSVINVPDGINMHENTTYTTHTHKHHTHTHTHHTPFVLLHTTHPSLPLTYTNTTHSHNKIHQIHLHKHV